MDDAKWMLSGLALFRHVFPPFPTFFVEPAGSIGCPKHRVTGAVAGPTARCQTTPQRLRRAALAPKELKPVDLWEKPQGFYHHGK